MKLLLPLIATVLASAAHAASRGTPIPGTALERHEVRDALGRSVTYYANRPAHPAPILLMIQGSGCVPIIQGSMSTLYNLIPFAAEGRFTVLAVEKPFAGMKPAGVAGEASGCSAEFNADFTAERWLAAIEVSLADARGLPWVHRSRTLAFGYSEGAVMAALLAGRDREVTDVAMFGGSGTSQLFDLIARAYSSCFDRVACLRDVDAGVRAIQAAPDSSTSFVWGHPYKRWSSFFRVDPAAELLRGKARVYVAFGTADESVPALSQEIIGARLLAAGRDVTVRRVQDANHMLMPPGVADFGALDRETRAVLEWFWKKPAGQ